MNIVVSEASNLSLYSSQFNYEQCEVLNDEMKEFAEMTIMYAMQKYPDDDAQKSKFVRDKFIDKYGHVWSVCFIKNGNCWITYYSYFIEVLYNGYQVSIGRTSLE